MWRPGRRAGARSWVRRLPGPAMAFASPFFETLSCCSRVLSSLSQGAKGGAGAERSGCEDATGIGTEIMPTRGGGKGCSV